MSLSDIFKIGGFIAEWWWAVALVFAAVAIVLQFIIPLGIAYTLRLFGVRVLKILEIVLRWFTEKPEGRIVGVALILFFVGSSLFQWGANVARSECQAEKLAGQLSAMRQERDLAIARAEREAQRAAAYERLRSDDIADVARLAEAVAKAKLQSTKPGAKHDPQALLDDQCRLTRRGADFLRRH